MRHSALVLLMLISYFTMAQQKVSSTAFNLMLKGLLNHSVPEIGADSLAQHRQDFILLDARSPEEYAVSHLQNAHFVGFEEFSLPSPDTLPRHKPVVVYCAVGYRSEKIAEKLQEKGFEKVYNLYGGIFEWINRGHPVYHQQEQTQKVHAYDRIWGMWLKRGEKVY